MPGGVSSPNAIGKSQPRFQESVHRTVVPILQKVKQKFKIHLFLIVLTKYSMMKRFTENRIVVYPEVVRKLTHVWNIYLTVTFLLQDKLTLYSFGVI